MKFKEGAPAFAVHHTQRDGLGHGEPYSIRLQAQKSPTQPWATTFPMHIGFTGTRQGMTQAQKDAIRKFLSSRRGAVLHHGDAIGADAQAHDIAAELGLAVVIHPPVIEAGRAWKQSDTVREPKRVLTRNKDIVRETQLLLAAPAEPIEQARSGTWSTVRYARRLGRSIHVFTPAGEHKRFGPSGDF
jgi:hypothetical protein